MGTFFLFGPCYISWYFFSLFSFYISFSQINAEQRARGEPESLPPLGQHTRSVVTEAMPQRFVDEVGAHIASALAIAVFKGLVRSLCFMFLLDCIELDSIGFD